MVDESDAESLIFVYGSLKRGYSLHSYLADQRFHAYAVTEPLYRLLDCGDYPALIKVSTDGVAVRGEVYSVTPFCLQQLDVVECVSEGLYTREPVRLQQHGGHVSAYFYARSVAGLADCGCEWPNV